MIDLSKMMWDVFLTIVYMLRKHIYSEHLLINGNKFHDPSNENSFVEVPVKQDLADLQYFSIYIVTPYDPFPSLSEYI